MVMRSTSSLKMRLVEDNLNKNDEYGEKDYNHDRFVVLAQTATIIGKEYAPSILVGGATLACFFGAYNIMQKRNVALAAAYSLVQTAFNEYRARVKEEMGDEYDSHFRYGYELKKTKKSKGSDSGKKFDIVKPENGFGQMSMYSRLFGPYEFDVETGQYEGTRMFMNNHEMNYLALRNAQNRLNDRLRLSGHVFLNDVYDFLGLTRTKAGQIVGWKYMGEEDEGIEFMHTVDLFSYSDKDPILLDFNVMGPIINDMPELQ